MTSLVILLASTLSGAEPNLRVGDDVGRVERIFFAGCRRSCRIDIVDQALVERPRIDVAFPVVDDLVAEAIAFGLHVGNARAFHASLRSLQRLRARLCQERVDRFSRPLALARASEYIAFAMSSVVFMMSLAAGAGRKCEIATMARRLPNVSPTARPSATAFFGIRCSPCC